MSTPYCSTTKLPIYFVISTWAIIGVLVFMPMTIWTMHKYRKEHAFKHQKNMTSPKCLYCTQFTFYLACLLYLLSFLLIHVLRCIPTSIHSMFMNLGFLSYIVHWALLIAIYLARLYYVFKGTAYQLSKRHIWYYLLFSVGLIICIMLINVVRNVYYRYNLNLVAWVVSLLLIAMLNVVLSGMFVMKLKAVQGQVETAAITAKTVALMRKYTVLTMASSCSTLLFIVYLCFMTSLPRTATVQNIADMLNALDVYMDIVCTTFTFGFAKTAYYQVCKWCDRGLARLCGQDSVDEMNLKAMSIDLQVTKTKSVSTTDAYGGNVSAPNSPVSSATEASV